MCRLLYIHFFNNQLFGSYIMKPIKLFILVFLVYSIFGCASPQYDPVEYNYAVISSVAASRALSYCDNMDHEFFKKYIQDIDAATLHLQEYEKYTKNKKKTHVGISSLRQLVLDFSLTENFSENFCVHKLIEIQTASRIMANAFGNPGSFDICIYDTEIIKKQYYQSYEDGNITQTELENLISSLPYLEHIDPNCIPYKK